MKRTIFVGLLSFLLLGWCAPAEAQSLPDKKDKKELKDSLRAAKREAKMRKEMTSEERQLCDSLGERCVLPKFQGQGLAHFRNWISSNLVYPTFLSGGLTEGKVILSFIVEKDGSVTICEVQEATDPTFLNQVLSLMRRVQPWEPGYNEQGDPVRVKYVLPILFRLQSNAYYQQAPSDPYVRNNKPNTKGQTPSTLHQPHASYGY